MPNMPKGKRPPWIPKRQHDGNKGPDAAFYNSRTWRKLRAFVLQADPLCIECEAIATVVDHIKPIRQGGPRYELSNLQPMCTSCHNRKRANESREGGV
jgi:5-methylcytosine-specific restriction enzyme A